MPSSACCSPAPSSSTDRKSTRLNSSHLVISYAVFCLKKKKKIPEVCMASDQPAIDKSPHRLAATATDPSDMPLHSSIDIWRPITCTSVQQLCQPCPPW